MALQTTETHQNSTNVTILAAIAAKRRIFLYAYRFSFDFVVFYALSRLKFQFTSQFGSEISIDLSFACQTFNWNFGREMIGSIVTRHEMIGSIETRDAKYSGRLKLGTRNIRVNWNLGREIFGSTETWNAKYSGSIETWDANSTCKLKLKQH